MTAKRGGKIMPTSLEELEESGGKVEIQPGERLGLDLSLQEGELLVITKGFASSNPELQVLTFGNVTEAERTKSLRSLAHLILVKYPEGDA